MYKTSKFSFLDLLFCVMLHLIGLVGYFVFPIFIFSFFFIDDEHTLLIVQVKGSGTGTFNFSDGEISFLI